MSPKVVTVVFLGLVLAIFTVAYLEKRSLEQALLQEAFLGTYEAVLKEVPRYLDAEALSQPASPAAKEQFYAFFHQIKTSPMVRLTLWSRDHRILFSNLKSIIGYASPEHTDLKRLFVEEKPFFLRRFKDDNWPPQSGIGEFLDIYIPIRISGQILGGMEVHSAVAGILAPVKKQSYYNAAILVASAAAILIVCLLAKHLKDDRDRQNALAVRNAELYQETKKQSAELQRSNAELEQFAYVVSHDLQEPLRMITGYGQLLSKRYHGKLDANADEFFHYMLDGAKRMQRLIADLLSYSRVGTKGKAFQLIDCETLVEQTVRTLKVAIEDCGAVVTHDPDLPPLLGDRTQLEQLLQNLIGNAVKYRGSEPPRVHLSCEREGDEWRFSVTDNGIGIDPQFAERIFVIFQRLHTSQEYAGTGIGLAVCKKIVERHGGRIWVKSELGKGATFYFTIPAQSAGNRQESSRMTGAAPLDQAETSAKELSL